MVPSPLSGIDLPRTGRVESHLYGTALAAKMWLTCTIVTKKFSAQRLYLSADSRTGMIACTPSPSKATLPIATSTPKTRARVSAFMTEDAGPTTASCVEEKSATWSATRRACAG